MSGVLLSTMTQSVGRSLTSVEFVRDYIQFRFDGHCLTTVTLPVLKLPEEILRPTDEGYREALCSQIGALLQGVDLSEEELTVRFANSVVIIISLRPEDYTGPEAIHYVTENGTWIVA